MWILCCNFGGKNLMIKNLRICKARLRSHFSQSCTEDFCEVNFLPLGGLQDHNISKLLPGKVLIKKALCYFFFFFPEEQNGEGYFYSLSQSGTDDPNS